MKKKVCLLFYYLFFQHLPSSYFPFGELFNFLRIRCLSQVLKVGDRTRIQSRVYVGNGENISIGKSCRINERVKLDNISIGDYVMIAPGVTILGKTHVTSDVSRPMILQGDLEAAQTTIENDVWIGTNAVILPGLKISEGTIIGAGAVITKDTDPYGIYGGVPAKKIKSRIN